MEEEKVEVGYKTFSERVEEIKEAAAKSFKDKIENKQDQKNFLFTKEQMDFCAQTIDLLKNEAFQKYLWLEQQTIASELAKAYIQKNHNKSLTYGESMSYNEGFYHGLLKMKAVRDNLWESYKKTKQQTKGE